MKKNMGLKILSFVVLLLSLSAYADDTQTEAGDPLSTCSRATAHDSQHCATGESLDPNCNTKLEPSAPAPEGDDDTRHAN